MQHARSGKSARQSGGSSPVVPLKGDRSALRRLFGSLYFIRGSSANEADLIITEVVFKLHELIKVV